MEHIKVVLDWFPNTNHTGLLIAQKRGWYKDAGLDVEIDGKVHGVMALHGADIICGPENSMLDLRNMGTEITAIATFHRKCDSGIVSLKEAGITRPRELEGKRLSHWAPEWFHKTIGHIVEEDGGDYSKVILVQKDVGDIVGDLGKVCDATWVYENWENYVLRAAGKEINYFNLGDYDPVFNFCAPAMAATKKILTEHPDAIRKFLKITDDAFQEVAAHPDETIMEVKEFMPEGCSDEMLKASQRHVSCNLLDENGHWGKIEPEHWNPMAELLEETGVISRRWDDEWTNDYLPR